METQSESSQRNKLKMEEFGSVGERINVKNRIAVEIEKVVIKLKRPK